MPESAIINQRACLPRLKEKSAFINGYNNMFDIKYANGYNNEKGRKWLNLAKNWHKYLKLQG